MPGSATRSLPKNKKKKRTTQQSAVREETLKINSNGEKRWYLNGELHRVDGPAVEYANGNKWWYLNGKFHRVDGPAVEHANGDKYWYLNGELHRTDGPAIEYENGYKAWYLNGKFHRENGPAIEYAKGSKEWCLNGKQVSPDQLPSSTKSQRSIHSQPSRSQKETSMSTDALQSIRDQLFFECRSGDLVLDPVSKNVGIGIVYAEDPNKTVEFAFLDTPQGKKPKLVTKLLDALVVELPSLPAMRTHPSKLKEGDIIISDSGDSVFFISYKEANEENKKLSNGSIEILNPVKSKISTQYLTKNEIFGDEGVLHYKIPPAFKDPSILLMLNAGDNNNDIGKLLALSMAQGGDAAPNINAMLPMLLLKGDGNLDKLLPFLLMQQGGENNPLQNMNPLLLAAVLGK